MRLADETPQTRTYHEIAWQLADLVPECSRYGEWYGTAKAAVAKRLPDHVDQLRWWNSEFGVTTRKAAFEFFRKQSDVVDVEPPERQRTVTVRMTSTLHDSLKDVAAGRGISLNSLCIERLQGKTERI